MWSDKVFFTNRCKNCRTVPKVRKKKIYSSFFPNSKFSDYWGLTISILLITLCFKTNRILVSGVTDSTAVIMTACLHIKPVCLRNMSMSTARAQWNVEIQRVWSATRVDTSVTVLTWPIIFGPVTWTNVCPIEWNRCMAEIVLETMTAKFLWVYNVI